MDAAGTQQPTAAQRSAKVAGVFDRAAETYDDVGVPWFGPVADDLVGALDVHPGDRVLDVGCGRGAVLSRLAQAVGPQGRASGFDLAPEMVRRTAADLAHLPQVDVRVDDAQHPDLPPGAFDVVAASLVLFFLPEPLAGLRSWVQLLVPGGRLGITTFGEQDARWQAVDDAFTPYLPPALLDARASGRTGPFASDEGVEQLLRDAGLVDVRTQVRAHTAVFADEEHWHTWSWSHGQRVMWESVPVEEHAEIRRRAGEQLRQHRTGDGVLAFGQQVRTTTGRRPVD